MSAFLTHLMRVTKMATAKIEENKIESRDQSGERVQSTTASNQAWDLMREQSVGASHIVGGKDRERDVSEICFDNPFTSEDGKYRSPKTVDGDCIGKKEDSFLWGNHGDDPMAAIVPGAVRQGNLGDCYFLSTLASKANEDPQSVKDMIKDNNNGTYTVTFPGDPTHPVTVDKPTEGELSKYAHGGEDGAWVNVIEKAHRKYTGRETQDGGDDPAVALKLLSKPGTGVVNDDLSGGLFGIGRTTEENVAKDIKNALENNRMIVASTSGGDSTRDWLREHLGADNNPGDLDQNHAYSVVGYDEKSKTVTMRNPHGGDGKEGTFQVSLDDFYNHFTNMEFAQS
jgi:hypothetical protein